MASIIRTLGQLRNHALVIAWLSATSAALCPAACAAEPSAGEKQLQLLEGQYNSQQAKVRAEAANVTDREVRDRLFLEHDPANSMIDEFLKLEEQHRGTLVGLSALHHLVSVAGGSYGFNGDFPVSDGGRRALKVLADHYAQHPDLDVFFFWLKSDPAVEAFLKVASQSPHQHVRGTARFTLARIRQIESQVPVYCDSVMSLLASDPSKHAAEINRLAKLRQNFTIDPATSREDALQLLDEVIAQYGDVLEAPRTSYGPVPLKIERGEQDALTSRTRQRLAPLAESMKFELTHLSVGQPAPEIAGPDALGNDLKLSDCRGKATVIMFSFKGCGPCEAMYPENRKLIEDYSARPLTFVGVMGDPDVATVKQSVEDKTITWPVWWDGELRGPLATKWNVTSWPTIYVLDHKGVFRYRNLRGENLALAVARLVEEAEQAR
jgi:peroxiredoxin